MFFDVCFSIVDDFEIGSCLHFFLRQLARHPFEHFLRARETGSAADRALARKLAGGLMRAASVSDVKGMVVRGFGTDGVCHYPLGSEDQTIPWFYGLYAYWRSGIPPSDERKAVAQFSSVSSVQSLSRVDSL